MTRSILRAGLTGGIASGKTTVAGFFAELGAFVLDADRIAHDLIRRDGEAYVEVVARFGESILDEAREIRRPALGRIVFSDPSALADLNAILHPRILAESERRIAHYSGSGHATVAILDAALLVEAGIHRKLDRLVVVRCSRDAQVRRLLARGMSAAAAAARIDAQAPLEEKVAAADYVIDTETTLRETRSQTERTYARLVGDFEEKFGPPGSRRS